MSKIRFAVVSLSRMLTVGFVLLGFSVVLIPYGVLLQTKSERFPAFEAAQIRDMDAPYGGRDRGADVSFLQYAWPVVLLFCLFMTAVFTVGVGLTRILAHSYHDLSLVMSGAFGCGCFLGALLALGQAGLYVAWGFTTLAIGYLTAAAGLALGAVGTVVNCLVFWDEIPDPAE